MWSLEIIKRMNRETRAPNGRLLSSTIEYTNEGIEILLVHNSGRRIRKAYPAVYSVTIAQDKVNELVHSMED